MKILFNSDNNITGTLDLQEQMLPIIENDLKLFTEDITRLEVHLIDENSHKNAQDDKRCMMEARIEGRPPIAVTEKAANRELAVKGASAKMKAKLTSVIGKMKEVR